MAKAAGAFDAVLKLGGSLGRGPGLTGLAVALGELARDHRLLVVPGGGAFADAVREHYHRYDLGETAAHRMALLAMDQYGYLLAELVPASVAVRDLSAARRTAADGRLPILLPSGLLLQADPLPHSWQVTSDSLAAWIAGRVAAPRFVLLKDVDGLYAKDPRQDAGGAIRPEMRLEELASLRGGVDEYLATVLAGPAATKMECWVINGKHPARLAELLATGTTCGTCLRH